MCGIVAYFTTDKSPVDMRALLQRYTEQRTRGHDGFGFSYLTKSGKVATRRYMFEAECFMDLGRIRSPLVLLHHRYPTSTKNNPLQNQPITNSSIETGKQFIIAHNGIIGNDDVLYKEHPEVYSTFNDTAKNFNDSEALLIELMHHVEQQKAVKAEGSIAFILLECAENGQLEKIHFGRNERNPLYMDKVTETMYSLSSTHPAIKSEQQVTENVLFTYDWINNAISSKVCTFPTTFTKSTNGSRYPVTHYNHGGNGYTPSTYESGYDDFDQWPETTGRYKETGVGFTAKGSRPRIVERKKTKAQEEREKRADAHVEYMDSIKNAEDVLKNCALYDPKTVEDTQGIRILTDIDEAIEGLEEAYKPLFKHEPRRIEALKKQLTNERANFLQIMDDDRDLPIIGEDTAAQAQQLFGVTTEEEKTQDVPAAQSMSQKAFNIIKRKHF